MFRLSNVYWVGLVVLLVFQHVHMVIGTRVGSISRRRRESEDREASRKAERGGKEVDEREVDRLRIE